MQQLVDGERVEIACIDLFLLAEDSGGEANRTQRKRLEAAGES